MEFLTRQPSLIDIKPNVYANPAEAIAPNGKYLIQFKVIRANKVSEPEDDKKPSLKEIEMEIYFDS